MNKFEIKKHTFLDTSNPVDVYVSCSTSTVNPLEIEKDVDDFILFMEQKYKIKTTKLTFKEWLIKKLKNEV